jgi:GAF domain
LDGLRRAIADMAEDGASLGEMSAAIVETAGLDAERRAALWLYARSCSAGRAGTERGEAGREAGRVHASRRPSEPRSAREGRGGAVPYVRCPNCGLTTYIARNRWRAGDCPGCGEPLAADEPLADAPPPLPPGDSGSEGGIADALALAREQLDMDVALLTEVEEGREVIREAAGGWPGLGPLRGLSTPFEDTFCKRLLEGRISNVVPDVAGDARVRDLELARRLGVGAWIGVPVHPTAARAWMLCCLARVARPALDNEDVRFLDGLGEAVRSELEASLPN